MSFSKIFIENKNKLNAKPRFGHVAVMYEDRYLIVYGGCDYQNIETLDLNRNLADLWIFDTELELWRSYPTDGGEPFMRLSGSCGLLHSDYLYIFAGFSNGRHVNEMRKLNLKTFIWSRNISKGFKQPSPRDKLSGWVHNNRLYYFGGFGESPNPNYLNNSGDFTVDPEFSDRYNILGWNNQLIYFDVYTELWYNPAFNGYDVPLPRAAHTCTYMNNNKVVLFGGRTLHERTNDLYILDLQTLTWSENLNSLANQNPVGRSWMSSVKLNNNELLIYGGFTGDFEALGDAWVFNIETLIWTEILKNKLEKRLWHTANVIEKTNEVYIFGGCFRNLGNEMPDLPKHILKISMRPKSLKKICVDFICLNINLLSYDGDSIPYELRLHVKENYASIKNKPVNKR